MQMPGRKYEPASGYRYGFNGKERDKDISAGGQDYGLRIYDTRLGKFLSVDPLTGHYPELTPYQFASNSPSAGIDLDGGEILPVNSSIYLQQYSGYTFLGKKINMYHVETRYNNIPKALRNPNTHNLKFTRGGPVTPFGRDWDVEKDGAYISTPGRYFNSGPKFNGLPPGSMEPSAATKPVGDYYEDNAMAKSTGVNKIGNAAAAIKEAYEIGENLSNIKVWNAMSKEGTDRYSFYTATKLIDKYLDKNLIGDKQIVDGQGRVDLINFITDGTLPTRGSKIEGLTLSQLENNLRIIYTGIQVLYREKLPYQKEMDNTISGMIQKYEEKGGKIQFEKLYDFDRPKK